MSENVMEADMRGKTRAKIVFLVGAGDYEEAEKTTVQALRGELSNDFFAWHMRGAFRQLKGFDKHAQEYHEKARNIRPHGYDDIVALGQTYIDMNLYDDCRG